MIAFFFFFYNGNSDAIVPVSVNKKDVKNVKELNLGEETLVLKISIKRYKEIKRTAIECYKHFNTKNPFVVFEYLNINYSFIKLEGLLAGFTHSSSPSNTNTLPSFHVYINTRYDVYSQKIIAAHELGHICIHQKDHLNMLDNSTTSTRKEYEANIFAMEFMPHIQPKGMNYLDFSPKELQNYICSKLL